MKLLHLAWTLLFFGAVHSKKLVTTTLKCTVEPHLVFGGNQVICNNHICLFWKFSEFLAAEDKSLFWKFVDNVLVNSDAKVNELTHEKEYELSLKIASELLTEARTDLLKLALSLRLYSPRVQVHQQIGNEYQTATDCSTFVDINGNVVCDAAKIQSVFESKKNDELKAWIYTTENVYPNTADSDTPLIILYAKIGTSKFASFHRVLSELAKADKIRYVFRHFDHHAEQAQVGLSGFGVELAIKNTEYKAVDDSASKDDKDADGEIHGFNFGTLRKNLPHLKDSLKQFKAHLSELEELSALKQWEVSDLSLQSAQKIMDSPPEEALTNLVDLAQNFPIRARTLVQTKLNEAFKKEVAENQAYLGENYNINEGENALFINGMNIDVDTLDVFQLFDTVRSEIQVASSFYEMGFRREYLSVLYSQNFGGESTNYAIDFREAYPEYLNNLDHDKQYSNWGNSVKSLLQPTYMGMLRPIARNFFTLIFVVDPADPASKSLMNVGHSLFVHKVPIRIGYIFVVNQHKTVSGMNDPGVALLNLYNFAKSDRNSAAKALDLVVKTIENAGSELTVGKIHTFFKKKFPDINIEDVFTLDSDYDSGRSAGSAFVKRSGIGKAPKVMLNGIILDDNTLTTDKIEESILMQIMRQTSPLQRAIMSGKLTDKDNVQNWILSQPDVLIRLNNRLINTPTKVLSLENVTPCTQFTMEKFKKATSSQKSQCIVENSKYLTRKDEARTRWLTLWLVTDLDSTKGRQIVLNAVKFLKKSNDARVSILHNGKTDSKIAKLIQFVFASLPTEQCKLILQKMVQDEKWLKKLEADFAVLKEIVTKDPDFELLKKKFHSYSTEPLKLEREFIKTELELKEGQNGIVVNGQFYGPFDENEELEIEDFSLLEQLAQKRGAKALSTQIEEWKVDVASGKSSDVVMRSISAALAKYAVRKQRQYLSVPGDAESVINLLATDQKRPIIDIVMVVDPLSKIAQKLAPIVLTLTRVVNADLRIVFNPKAKLSELPLKRFYRFALNEEPLFDTSGKVVAPALIFSDLPNKQLLTLSVISPDSWMVQPVAAEYDLDNIKMETVTENVVARFELIHLLLEGHCFDVVTGAPPRGLQFILGTNQEAALYDTIVMSNLGYFQLKAAPGAWILQLREGKSKNIYEIKNHTNTESDQESQAVRVVIDSFLGKIVRVRVGKQEGKEDLSLLSESGQQDDTATLLGLNDDEEEEDSIWSSISGALRGGEKHDTINIFSLASGHLYERFLRIMMVSVVKNTKHPVKFWLLNNYLSPQFRSSLPKMAEHYKVRSNGIMWGYKILFLDVLFPLNIKKIIFVDADQVIRTDMIELMNFDLGGAPYAYTPFCDSRTTMEGFRFWKKGYWASHLAGRRYHISALYVVDLAKFRQIAAGDRLRGQYQGLSADPNSLSNLDQDLPNNMIHQVRIKSLPQEWLWCETWCSDESKKEAKTIDLCNNPLTKEPKLDSAVRIIGEWTEYDQEIKDVLSGSAKSPEHKHGDEL
ncbi:UDP-glucose:glycoprotein glucosyltransferase 1 [Aphelenchoides bicaudatus]|nr:UDP-glucose:glycoprotein glucosyltransferase 1 [Aphelenchoides bicaudatus]